MALHQKMPQWMSRKPESNVNQDTVSLFLRKALGSTYPLNGGSAMADDSEIPLKEAGFLCYRSSVKVPGEGS